MCCIHIYSRNVCRTSKWSKCLGPDTILYWIRAICGISKRSYSNMADKVVEILQGLYICGNNLRTNQGIWTELLWQTLAYAYLTQNRPSLWLVSVRHFNKLSAPSQYFSVRNQTRISHNVPYFIGSHNNDVIMSTMASHITSLTIVYSTVYSGADQRKHQSSASLTFLRGIHRWPENFCTKVQ